MSARKLFEKAKAELLQIEQKSSDLREEVENIQGVMSDAFRMLLVEEKILSQKPWVLNIHPHACELVCKENSSSWEELSDCVESNYHCSFLLKDSDGTLCFDDGEISISIHDVNHLKSVIDTYELQVSLSAQTSFDKEKMQKTLAEIEKWESIFKK